MYNSHYDVISNLSGFTCAMPLIITPKKNSARLVDLLLNVMYFSKQANVTNIPNTSIGKDAMIITLTIKKCIEHSYRCEKM